MKPAKSLSMAFLFVIFISKHSSAQTAQSTVAQAPTSRNFSYIEAGGAGLFGSVNYERQVSKKPGVNLRAGVGFYTENAFYMTLPVGLHYLFPVKRKPFYFFDAGITYTRAWEDGQMRRPRAGEVIKDRISFVVPSFSYRSHRPNGIMWRAGVGAVVNPSADVIVPWVGLALGKHF